MALEYAVWVPKRARTECRENSMSFTSWRGIVGCIKPTMRPGSIEELIRMLPEGVGLIPLFLDIRQGTTDEFKRAIAPYEPLVARLAEAGCDLIHPEGAPPFMLLGYEGEAELLRQWEAKYKVPLFTSGTNHVRALRALGVRRFVGATYFSGPINDAFARYFAAAGFEVLGMEGLALPFEEIGAISAHEVYAHVKRAFLKHPNTQAVYLLGSGWRVLDVIDLLERDLGVPVVHPVPARCWEIQRRLRINQPVEGYGRLLAEMVPG
jgi:maleate isomerase